MFTIRPGEVYCMFNSISALAQCQEFVVDMSKIKPYNALNMPTLRELRWQAVLTQAELAQNARVSRTTVIAAEKGRRPRPRTIRALAKALGVKPQDIEWPFT